MTAVSAARPTNASEGHAELVTRLRTTFDSGRTRGHAWRERQLDGLSRLLKERADEIAAALTADLRRTPFEAKLFDIAPTAGEVSHTRKHLRGWMQPQRVKAPMNIQPGKAWYQHEPLGVTLVIAPWNYPVHLALTPLAAALAAGNCVIVKPSEITPDCSAVLARLLPLYLDPEAVAVVEGGAEASLGLLEQGVDHCFFTGSPAVGRAIMAAAAPHLTPVTLELGGKCPVVITASAQLEIAARRVAFGKLVNSGQTCVAPDYVLVDRSVRDEFVGLLTKTLAEFSETKRMPIVNSRHTTRIADLLSTSGGTTVLGGQIDVGAAEAEATIVLDPDPGSALMSEEIFGPLLPVVTVDSLDDAIALVRRGSHPLAAYLFTEDRNDEERFLDQVTSGGTVVNHVMMHLAVSDLPFGGVGTSGMGRYHGKWGFDTFSYPKAVVRKSSRPDLKLFYPPYSPLAKRIMNKMLDT